MIGLKHALRGFILVFKEERNFRIELFIFAGVVVFGYLFGITKGEWIAVLIISALVLSTEVINSALERVCDLYSTESHSIIKNIKDISAAAVLLTSTFAVIIGVYVFYPYISLLILTYN